jgi:hypothetical protein
MNHDPGFAARRQAARQPPAKLLQAAPGRIDGRGDEVTDATRHAVDPARWMTVKSAAAPNSA